MASKLRSNDCLLYICTKLFISACFRNQILCLTMVIENLSTPADWQYLALLYEPSCLSLAALESQRMFDHSQQAVKC
jgi:hypothetical protein